MIKEVVKAIKGFVTKKTTKVSPKAKTVRAPVSKSKTKPEAKKKQIEMKPRVQTAEGIRRAMLKEKLAKTK